MQNYSQSGFERPGSTMSFAGQQQPPPPPVPQYNQQQWGQQPLQQQHQQLQHQAASGYNPGIYGAMPGGCTQNAQYPQTSQSVDPYATQPHGDVPPPPPPPKPHGFAAAVQKQNQNSSQLGQGAEQAQSWQESQHGHTPHAQHGGYPVYNNAPPPLSNTSSGSYFPQLQGGRPSSIYGPDQVGTTSTPVNQQSASTVMSPNEQTPAYIPPSLSGQGVQAYMPSNTNPMPGVYVPPPPDVPAWQQTQQAPSQGGNKKFTYTKPTVDPSFYAQGYQGVQQPPPLPPRLTQVGQQAQPTYGQQPPQYPHQGHALQQQQQNTPIHAPFSQQQAPVLQPPIHFGQLGQPVEPLQQQNSQSPVPQTYIQQQAARLEQYAQNHQQQQMHPQTQSPAQLQPQWQAPAPLQNSYVQQQQPGNGQSAVNYQPQQQPQQQPQYQWHSSHQPQQPAAGQPHYPVSEQTIPAPRPLDRTDTMPPTFLQQASPQPQIVSPVASQSASSFAPNHPVAARTDSVSSIALANLHSQRTTTQSVSPKPSSFNVPAPPPPRDDASRFSALGKGGPSDWETFGVSDEIDDEALFARKPKPVQLDSVELPARQPSPPSTQGWPSPADNTAYGQSTDRHDTYQPTPPTATVSPVHRVPSSGTPQQRYASVAPLQASPQSLQRHGAHEDPHHGFVMGEVLWDGINSSNQTGNASRRAQLEGHASVADDSQTTAPVQVAPIQIPASSIAISSMETQRQNRPGTTRFFSDVGSTFGLSSKDGSAQHAQGSKGDNDLAAKLQSKDEELWRLRTESKEDMRKVQAEIEAKNAGFLATIQQLKTDEQAARVLADKQSQQLDQQVEAMKAAAEQAKLDADALKKESALTIERIKEDVEGKEDAIKDHESTIESLRKELDDLRTQFDYERTKEVPQPPKPTASDMIPDLDPWYAGSLERYIVMLRGEANEPLLDDKIKTFRAFMKAESAIRGIEFYDAAPNLAPVEPENPTQLIQPVRVRSSQSVAQDLNVTLPQETDDDDEYMYSPGGRPLITRPTVPAGHIVPTHAPFVSSSQSAAILTPTSSVHDDSTPVQSPSEEQAQPQYKAYVPPIMSSDASSSLAQRTATASCALPGNNSSGASGEVHDEIFFGTRDTSNSRTGHTPSSSDDTGGVPVVAPLNFGSNRPVSVSLQPKINPVDALKSLLQGQVQPAPPSPLIEKIRKEATAIKLSSQDAIDLKDSWEKSASLTRRKNVDARRKRAEENEAHNDDLFNSDEISYAELKDLEAEFKAKEDKLKTQEDQDECKSYVESVFDKTYNNVQGEIAALTDLYIEAETLLQTSVSGVKSLQGGDAPTTKACLELLLDLHKRIEETHEQVVLAIAERDRRYKKTEIQALFTSGNIAKKKAVEKHFEQAEKQAEHRAKNQKAERLGDLVKVAEEAVVGAASIEQNERGRIVAAIRDLNESDSDADILKRASETLDLLHESSKALLTIFNRLEIDLNTAEVDADIARAKVDGAPELRVEELLSEMKARELELIEEFTRRINVLGQDRKEVEQLTKQTGQSEETNDKSEKEKRLKAALEEAKRRNGHA